MSRNYSQDKDVGKHFQSTSRELSSTRCVNSFSLYDGTGPMDGMQLQEHRYAIIRMNT